METGQESNLIDITRRYFLGSCDRESRVWIFCRDKPSAFLPSSVHFGDDQFGIHIVDEFAGLQPILLNLDTFTRDEIRIPFRPTAILDSNVVGYLHQYVSSEPALDPQRRETVHDFLRFVVSNRLDYNPFFYYMEAAAKDEDGTLTAHARAVSESILRLHTMDNERFLATGDIVTESGLVAEYATEFGVATIEEIAPLYARAMVCPTDPRVDGLSRLIYASLLKVGLIHKRSRRGVAAKYEELRLFMQQTLDIAMGAERMLALGYFAGQYDEFIPIQRGANPDRLLKRLRAATWDMLLPRLPAEMLVSSIEDGVVLGYVCTSDRTLRQLAEGCKIEAVMGVAPKAHQPLPFMSYDLSALKQILGAEAIAEITKRDAEWQRSRLPRLTESAERISYDDLLTVIADLEAEVLQFCAS